MELTVSRALHGKRLDQALKAALPEISRAAIQKAVKAGACAIDAETVSDPACKLKYGQTVKLDLPQNDASLLAEEGELSVIWQDDWLAVVNKPAALSVHPCPSCPENTLCQRLLFHFPQLSEQGGERPGIVHRLDKDTSGVILIALTEQSRLKFAEAFSERKIDKTYLALVYGKAPETGECHEPIGRHETLKIKMAVIPENRGGKTARTTWRRLWYCSEANVSLLEVKIYTGRTHQIRVHLSHLGYPLLGDKAYAPKFVQNMAPRQMLHAWKVSFLHPQTAVEMNFCVMPPEDFFGVIQKNCLQAPLVVITGSQGSGKSTFAAMLADFGLPLISADAVVADLYKNAGPVAQWLKKNNYGSCLADGAVSKAALLEAMTANPELRPKLEEYAHALVFAEIDNFYKSHCKEDVAAVLAEVPLYFESGGKKKYPVVPYVIGVNCGAKIRWERLAKNRGWDMQKIQTIEAWQWPEEKKMQASDLVVNNFGNETDLRNEALKAFNLLESMREKKIERLMTSVKQLCSCNYSNI